MLLHKRFWRRFGFFCALVGVLTLLTGQNCVPPDQGDGDGEGPPPAADQPPNIVFTQPAAGTRVAIGDEVAVALNANDPENNFTYALLYDRDGTFNGNEVQIATGTRTGTSLVQATWATAGLAAGQYYIAAVVIDAAGNTDRAFSEAVTLVAPPSVEVLAPAAPVERQAGQMVNVVFSAVDPIGGATVNVFFDTDENFENGVAGMIRQGLSATATSAEWNTTGVSAGTYFVGASIGTDAAGRLASYATGRVTIAGTAAPDDGDDDDDDDEPVADVTGLQLSVTAPAAPLSVGRGASVRIEFEASDTLGQAWIDLYYVPVSSEQGTPPYTGDEPRIATNLPLSTRSYNWRTEVNPGLYAIGATLGRTETARIRAMAPGRVLVTPPPDWEGDDDDEPTVRAVTIAVTAPLAEVTIRPDNEYPVTFTLDPADAAGTVRLYYALDGNRDHRPDAGSDWVQFAVVPVPASTTVVPFRPVEVGLTDGMYAIKAVYETQAGSEFFSANPTGDIAAGWVEVRPQYWMGDVASPRLRSAVFEGVNYYDLAGTAMTPVADIDGDGIDDFVIVSQFGKPGWDGFGYEGTGVGEAYVIYGGPYLEGRRWKLNATGVQDPVDGLPGLVLTGLGALTSFPPTLGDRGGISGVIAIPDQDGDGRPEIVFAFPEINSQGSSILSKEGQFRSGGYVIFSSMNSLVGDPLAMPSGGRSYRLLSAGQNFASPQTRTPFDVRSHYGWTEDLGCCLLEPRGPWGRPHPDCADDEREDVIPCEETVVDNHRGFTTDHFVGVEAFRIWNNDPSYGGYRYRCLCPPMPLEPIPPPADPDAWDPLTGNPWWIRKVDGNFDGCGLTVLLEPYGYPLIGLEDAEVSYFLDPDKFGDPDNHDPIGVPMSTGFFTTGSLEPYGMRMIGQQEGDYLAFSMSFVDDMLLVSAPHRGSHTGEAYRLQLRNRHGLAPLYYYYDPVEEERRDIEGPRPYQYVMNNDGMSHCFGSGIRSPGGNTFRFYHSDPDGELKLGYAISGAMDINDDGISDVAIGAPGAYGGDGAIYFVYRRVPSLDTDRDLLKIQLAQTDDQDRRVGTLIRGRDGEGEQLGKVVGTGADLNGSNSAEYLDLNQDGRADLVFGNQHYGSDQGEVVILLGHPNLESPEDGFVIDGNEERGLVERGLGALIKGEEEGDLAGFNVAYAGDFNGDGWPDLLVAAPGANVLVDPTDPTSEQLEGAGKVYLILGANHFEPGRVYSLAMVGRPDDPDFDPDDPAPEAYMKKGLRGLVFAGHRAGDALGGGEDVPYLDGGIGTTGWRGRSISWAGDVNIDGFDDILIGAPQADAGARDAGDRVVTQAGEVYLIFGHSF